MLRPKPSIERLAKIAANQGGRCLSTEYLGSQAKHLFTCSSGHTWETTANNICNGTWCPFCAGSGRFKRFENPTTPHTKRQYERNTLERMHQVANERGGKCLSDVCGKAADKYMWRCVEGHTWKATAIEVCKNETWCPYCARRRPRNRIQSPLDLLQQHATAKGGRCLSEKYGTMTDRYTWQCAEGHVWEATGKNVTRGGTWCRKCANAQRKPESASEYQG